MEQPILWCLKHPTGRLDYQTLCKRWRSCVRKSLPVEWWEFPDHWKTKGLPGWRKMKAQGYRIVRTRVVEVQEQTSGSRSKEDRQSKP